jgi:hypothetical protein
MLFAYVFELLRGFLFFYSEVEKIDDIGWKAKLKIPPKDRRVQTSVSPTLGLHVCGSF